MIVGNFKRTDSLAAVYTRRWRDRHPDKARITRFNEQLLIKQHSKTQSQYSAQKKTVTARNKGKSWTQEEDLQLLRTDVSLTEIALLIGRTFFAARLRRQTITERAGYTGQAENWP